MNEAAMKQIKQIRKSMDIDQPAIQALEKEKAVPAQVAGTAEHSAVRRL